MIDLSKRGVNQFSHLTTRWKARKTHEDTRNADKMKTQGEGKVLYFIILAEYPTCATTTTTAAATTTQRRQQCGLERPFLQYFCRAFYAAHRYPCERTSRSYRHTSYIVRPAKHQHLPASYDPLLRFHFLLHAFLTLHLLRSVKL